MDQFHSEWLVELPTILDSLFHKVDNTTSTGGDSSDSKKFYVQMASIQVVLSFTYRNVSWPALPASHEVIPFRLSSCPDIMGPFMDHPSIFGHQTG